MRRRSGPPAWGRISLPTAPPGRMPTAPGPMRWGPRPSRRGGLYGRPRATTRVAPTGTGRAPCSAEPGASGLCGAPRRGANRISHWGRLSEIGGQTALFRYSGVKGGNGMKVELRIDPGCGGVSVVINAPALTDEVKALAARLEGRRPHRLAGGPGRSPGRGGHSPLLRRGEGREVPDPGGVRPEGAAVGAGGPAGPAHFRAHLPLEIISLRRSPPWISPSPAPSG